MAIKGCLLLSFPIVKRFSTENFPSPTKWVPKMAVFRKNWGLYVIFYVQNPQKASVFCVKVSVGPLAVGERKNPKKRTFRSYISRICGENTPCRIYTKFCTTGDIRDVITPANFGFDRFRLFSVASGQILGFSIGFRRRPYNTLALPCECVMCTVAQYNWRTLKIVIMLIVQK